MMGILFRSSSFLLMIILISISMVNTNKIEDNDRKNTVPSLYRIFKVLYVRDSSDHLTKPLCTVNFFTSSSNLVRCFFYFVFGLNSISFFSKKF